MIKTCVAMSLAVLGVPVGAGATYCAFEVKVNRPDGNPVVGVSVSVVYKHTKFAVAKTDGRGAVNLCDAPLLGVDFVVGEEICGSVMVRQIKPLWLETRKVYVTYVDDSCHDFVSPPDCRILLRVRDANGRPIVGARFAGKPPPSAMDTERSDEFGRLFRHLSESGRLEGLVTRSGYLPASVSQACSPGVDRDVEVNIVLRHDR